MKVAFLTIGARGDVQPYASLAVGFREAGHRVRFATLERFQWLLEPLDLERVTLHHEPFRRLRDLARALPGPGAWRQLCSDTRAALDTWYEAAEGADCLIVHPLIYAAPDLAESLRIPLVVASTLPAVCPTSAFPNTYLWGRSLGPFLNRLSYRVMPWLLWPLSLIRCQWRRQRLGLRSKMSPLTGRRDLVVHHVHGHSEHVLPRPADWPEPFVVHGYWRPGRAQQGPFPDDLERFLSDGPPPIYVGFGSMRHPDQTGLTCSLVQAIGRLGCRAVLARCCGALCRDTLLRSRSESIFSLDARAGVSHDALFQRVSAVVQHGGPGTFGSALHAG
ncbi:MAG: glycosyltransferase, partial [Candidatus Eremiobacterota bacterium]